MTTHTLKAKTLRQELGITCDGCSIHAAAKTFIRAVGDGSEMRAKLTRL